MKLTPEMLQLLVGLLTTGIEDLLAAFHKNNAAKAVDVANLVAMSILRKTAEVQGLTLDWNDPAAVLAYVKTLPTLQPIPEP
jgi:hypothetical protein